jgi:hypothetical protein
MRVNWGAVTISIGLILLAASTSMSKADYVRRHCNGKVIKRPPEGISAMDKTFKKSKRYKAKQGEQEEML